MVRILFIILFCIGLWGTIAPRNLIRKIIGLSILNSSIVVLYVLAGRLDGKRAPILNLIDAEATLQVVDPVPQALMLTAIVVGLSVTAVALILSVQLYRQMGTLDIEEIEEKVNDHG